MEAPKQTIGPVAPPGDEHRGDGKGGFRLMAFMRADTLLCICLLAAILAVYWQVHTHEFLGLDDDWYVTKNSHVFTGLTAENIAWAFTPSRATDWHPIPLAWLSHMLDCQLFGLRAGWHHLTNLLLHMVNSLLLFFIFKRMTGSLWRSAFVSALFALHPLHVESVAWVAERKDVLSALFWMLTMWGYVGYVQTPTRTRYLLVVGFFVLGLMAKPMLVSLPFVLLLVDYWPLGRFESGETGALFPRGPRLYRLLREKAPLFFLAGAAALATVLASGRRDVFPRYIPLDLRVANAATSYVAYLGKMIFPFDLAAYYPFPAFIPGWKIAAACLVLVSISSIAAYGFRKVPYLAVGWLWYVVTIAPVSGVIPLGSHAMADRYTYIPLIGIFVILAWGVPDLLMRWRIPGKLFGGAAIVYLFFLSAVAWVQVGYWTDSTSLFEHTLKVTEQNAVIHNNLAVVLLEQGQLEQAYVHALKASEIQPGWVDPLINASEAAGRLGRVGRARDLLLEVLSLDPQNAMAHNNMGNVAFVEGDFRGALEWWHKAERIDPSNAQVLFNIALALERLGKVQDAVIYYGRFLERGPSASEESRFAKSRIENYSRRTP